MGIDPASLSDRQRELKEPVDRKELGLEMAKEKRRAYLIDYRRKNREKSIQYAKEWRKKNPLTLEEKKRKLERLKEWDKKNRLTPEYKEKKREYCREWNKRNPLTPEQRERHREHSRNRRKVYKEKNLEEVKQWRANNPEKVKMIYRRAHARLMASGHGRVRLALPSRIRKALKANKTIKSERTLFLLGCDLDWLKAWLEVQFQPGMSWENYGHGGWHVDHIRPCATFDLVNEIEQRRCFHWTNLQPLWAIDNLSKGDSYGL